MQEALTSASSAFKTVLHGHPLKWVPTAHMHADALTKLDKNLRDRCTTWLASPAIQLSSIDGSPFIRQVNLSWHRVDKE
eukprot:6337343-Amphidinium_carterae.1